MKAAFNALLGVALVFSAVAIAVAEDKPGKKPAGKVVTLKGEMCCAKCALGQTKVCTNAIKVKEGDKDVVYYLDDNKGKEKYHKEICTENKPGSVKGVVSKKKDQLYIKPEKDGVKFD